ncbi:MAG: lysoplasmalogenase [Saprospirales bacterium]|nr:lysoplasmalogenase [Saprospirales bacterium]
MRNGHLRLHPAYTAPFLVFLAVFLLWLWPGVPSGIRLPVLLYAMVITAMALSVVNMLEKISPVIFRSLLAGALLFMFSDCLIATAKFGRPFPGARIVIMVTYIAGQWLIVRGVSEQLRRLPEK